MEPPRMYRLVRTDIAIAITTITAILIDITTINTIVMMESSPGLLLDHITFDS